MYELVEEAHKVLRVPPPIFDFESPPEDPKEIEKNMIEAIERYGGLGLSANQCGLPYNMFVMRTADKGVVSFWNPKLLKVSQDTDNAKEGCLTALSEKLPMKSLLEGEEKMAIGGLSADPKTLENVFGIDNYKDFKAGLTMKEDENGDNYVFGWDLIFQYIAKLTQGNYYPDW